jgi:hypothetical protein
MDPKPRRPAFRDLQTLMDSPLYWTMNLKERLALIRNGVSSRDDGAAALRKRILTWIKTGS